MFYLFLLDYQYLPDSLLFHILKRKGKKKTKKWKMNFIEWKAIYFSALAIGGFKYCSLLLFISVSGNFSDKITGWVAFFILFKLAIKKFFWERTA